MILPAELTGRLIHCSDHPKRLRFIKSRAAESESPNQYSTILPESPAIWEVNFIAGTLRVSGGCIASMIFGR